MQNGKGDSPRKKSVSQEVWDRNWERIFGSKEKENNKKKEDTKNDSQRT